MKSNIYIYTAVCLCFYSYFYLFLVASLMSLMASLVTTSRMQQCFNVLIDSYRDFLLLFFFVVFCWK